MEINSPIERGKINLYFEKHNATLDFGSNISKQKRKEARIKERIGNRSLHKIMTKEGFPRRDEFGNKLGLRKRFKLAQLVQALRNMEA